MTDIRPEEGSKPSRERRNWRAPRKIVAIGAAPGFAVIAPSAQIVTVRNASEAAAASVDADIIVGLTSYPGVCEPEIIQNARELRWIMAMSAGVERCIDRPEIKARDILVTNLRGVESVAIAEHAIAMMMTMARGIDTYVLGTANAQWDRGSAARTEVQTLTGKTLLVVGLGGIGMEVAKRGHGLGMKVIATRASGRDGPDFIEYVGLPDELLKLAATADVVINTAPLTSDTHGLFDAKFFAAVKPSMFFINVARGASVVTEDLLRALHDGRIAGAGLDVVEPEPLPADHPLWRAPNVIISPHVSSASDLPREQRWVLARENLRRWMAGEKMLSEVDLEREY